MADTVFSRDVEAQARIDAACELYQSCIVKAKTMLESTFGKPTSYYDGEKKNVLQIAESFFNVAVTRQDIFDVVAKVYSNIDVALIEASDEDDGEVKGGDKGSVSNNPIMGF